MRTLFICLLIIFSIRALLGYQLGAQAWSIEAILSDSFSALLLYSATFLAGYFHRILAAVLMLLCTALLLASMESVIALGKPVDLRDLVYVSDGKFMRSSVAYLSHPWISLGLLILAIFGGWSVLRGPHPRHHWTLPFVAITGLLLSPGSQWQQSNLLALGVARAGQHAQATAISLPGVTDQGISIRSDGIAPAENIVLLVLEGIPGAYLKQLQLSEQSQKLPAMNALSSIARQGLIAPNAISHSPQTIRGLYAMLCGDYSKLSLDTFKASEYLGLAESQRPPCLPHLLAREGYSTHYLQAADLSFMEKDRFMPVIGFEEVHGRESLPGSDSDIGWGPDDGMFLTQAAQRIIQLHAKQERFFITLLTVGTHHPYTLPLQNTTRGQNRKLAAIQHLDQALADFWEALLTAGVMKDSLLLITSDESHGVNTIPGGGNWVSMVALGRDLPNIVNTQLYGLKDIQHSIMDYLGLANSTGNSLFRSYPEQAPQLAWSDRLYLADPLLGLHWCELEDFCWRAPSYQNLLFAPVKDNPPIGISGDEARSINAQIVSIKANADSRLKLAANREGVQTGPRVVDATPGLGQFLQAGQYLYLPAGSEVSVALKLRFSSAEADARLGVFQAVKAADPTAADLSGKIDLPELAPNEQLTLRYQFSTGETGQLAHPVLFSRLKGKTGSINLLEFSVSPSVGESNPEHEQPHVEIITLQ